MSKKRKRFTSEEKKLILKRHFLEKKAVSDLCDEYNIHPTMFYKWQKELFSNANYAFDKGKDKESTRWQKKALELENKLARKNEVLSELMEDHIALKKSLGAS